LIITASGQPAINLKAKVSPATVILIHKLPQSLNTGCSRGLAELYH